MQNKTLLELQRKIEVLERKNKLLTEGLRQAERQRQMFEQTAQELKATKLLLIQQGELLKDDVVKRKQAETALRESHQQLYSLLNSMAGGAYGTDIDGNCKFVNRAFLRILGYENEEEVIGKYIHELIHHSHRDGSPYPATECRMYAAYRYNMEVHVVDEVFWRKDGTAIPVEYWSQPVVIDGELTGAIATFIDISERKRIESQLADSESRLRAIIENEPECIKIVDAEGRVLLMNPAGLAMIEADSEEQVVGRSVFQIIAPEHRDAYANLHSRVLAGDTVQMEYEIIGIKGSRRWLETHAAPMKEANGSIVHIAVTRDISERKKSDTQLRIAATVFEATEGMMVTDANNNILMVNRAFTDITGYSMDESVGQNPRLLRSGRQNTDFYAAMWDSIINAGGWAGEIWNRRKNGDCYPEYLTITAVKDSSETLTHYVATHTDITLRKAAEEKIEHLAFYDPLTHLPNRLLLQDRLKQALAASQRSGRKGALLFIDLDNFKIINDTLGHDMGDLLLQQVAERLSSCIRKNDTVARLGGDEFVVMLTDLDKQFFEAEKQTEIIGNKILTILDQPYELASRDYVNTPSIGAVLFSGHERTREELLKSADIAMYQAKNSGRNTFRFFDPKMQNAITARFTLEDALRNALANQQLELYYQLQVDNAYHATGAEVLIRWPHLEYSLSPAEFISLAEEIGVILPIGQWMLEAVCSQLKAWQQTPSTRNLALSFNVSAKQFFHADFVVQVLATVQHYAINPMLLKLELTEAVLTKNVKDSIRIMNALREIGIQFSLDNFGTGYCSLKYLNKLPLSQLKVDQSFIRDIADNSSDQAIVCIIIAMAKSLNLNVIATGVESEEQLQFLQNNGCGHYQGYLFGKPMPLVEFEKLLLTYPFHS